MTKVQLLAAGKITSLIETIAKSGKQYQELVHAGLVQCLAHSETHGDRSLLARLIGGKIKSKDGKIQEEYPGVLSKATSIREVKLWVSEHSPLRWDKDDAIVVSKAALEKGVKYDIDAANEQPFWELPANVNDRARPLNMDNVKAVIFGARKRFEKAMEENRFDGDPVAMRQYLDAIEAIEMPKVNRRRVIHPAVEKAQGVVVEVTEDVKPAKRIRAVG